MCVCVACIYLSLCALSKGAWFIDLFVVLLRYRIDEMIEATHEVHLPYLCTGCEVSFVKNGVLVKGTVVGSDYGPPRYTRPRVMVNGEVFRIPRTGKEQERPTIVWQDGAISMRGWLNSYNRFHSDFKILNHD